MKATINTLLMAATFFFFSCGSDTERIVEIRNDEVNSNVPLTESQGCTISDLNNQYVLTCQETTLLLDGDVLSTTSVSNSSVILTASKKNGGTGGSKWFDSSLTLDEAVTLALPNEIPATGRAGNGQKLYVKFNDEVDCVWFSHANDRYRNPRCFEGATRNGGTSSGFNNDGTELTLTEVADVTTIEMHVNGASGSGIITTATGTFTKI